MSNTKTHIESVMEMVTVKDLDPARTALGLAIYLAGIIVPAILLVTTPKTSILRKIWIPCSFLSFIPLFIISKSYTGGIIRFYQGSIPVLLSGIQGLNLLHVNALDRASIATQIGTSPDDFRHCFYQSIRLMAGLRGIRTPYQVKGIPAHPPYVTRKGSSSIRARFLFRQFLVFTWQCIALDTFSVWSAQIAAQKPKTANTLPLSDRVVITVFTWFALSRVLIDSLYRFGAIIAVALGDDPLDWPPVMGSMWDAYTLRNFWGTFWHQLMRWPLTFVSNAVARDIMKLSRPSVVERYVNLTIVFLCSGLLHLIIDMMQGVPFGKSGSMTFFLGCALGIMIEDGVQKAYSVLTGTPYSRSDGTTRLWKRVVGFIWVVAWLCLLSPPYLTPLMELPKENRWFVPMSFVENLGVGAAAKGLMAGAVILMLHFDVSL